MADSLALCQEDRLEHLPVMPLDGCLRKAPKNLAATIPMPMEHTATHGKETDTAIMAILPSNNTKDSAIRFCSHYWFLHHTLLRLTDE